MLHPELRRERPDNADQVHDQTGWSRSSPAPCAFASRSFTFASLHEFRCNLRICRPRNSGCTTSACCPGDPVGRCPSNYQLFRGLSRRQPGLDKSLLGRDGFPAERRPAGLPAAFSGGATIPSRVRSSTTRHRRGRLRWRASESAQNRPERRGHHAGVAPGSAEGTARMPHTS